MILYKYCSTAGIKILENLSIRVTPPNEFNDPFEFTTITSGSVSPDHIRVLLTDEGLIMERFELIKLQHPDLAFEEYRESQIKLADDEDWISNEAAVSTTLYQEWAEGFVDRASRSAGVTCFTKDKSSILMWSHYAANHEGLMIGFDVRSFPYVKLFNVDYLHSEPVQIDLFQIHEEAYLSDKYIEVMSRKSPIWSYENEFRMQFHFSVCSYIEPIKMWFYHFEPTIIKEVYLGIKCNPEFKAGVLSLLNQDKFAHVRIYLASKSLTGYHVDYKEVDRY